MILVRAAASGSLSLDANRRALAPQTPVGTRSSSRHGRDSREISGIEIETAFK